MCVNVQKHTPAEAELIQRIILRIRIKTPEIGPKLVAMRTQNQTVTCLEITL